jgi:diguanylate cyclase (GGDEF)-like protein
MATTDMMTKLKIHHYFHTILIEEFNRAVKQDRPLSLIMADIDYFKSFNDMYGHVAGDKVLVTVAQAIKDNIRPMDIAARYGGEEFAVIMPKTEITEALIAAERIRESVSGKKVDADGRELSVTISIGLSQLDPLSDKHKNDLINRADRALYNSKKHGRNRVSFL